MEPRIQYAKTSDGVSIAYATLGQGTPPLVVMPFGSLDSLRLGWHIPAARRGYERLAKKRMLVRYDRRGFGLSERNVTVFSFDTLVLDLAAVADHLKLQTFVLTATLSAGPPAVAYTVAHPERVSRLVLWNAYASGADYWEEPWLKAVRGMRETDWPTYTEAASRLFFGGPEAAALIREGVTPEVYKAYLDAIPGFDVTHLLSQVRCPALVLHESATALTRLDTSRALASHIPGARLVVIEGDFVAAVEAIDEFLGEGEPAAAPLPSGTAVILFADIVDSTALTERLGDAAFRGKARELDAALRSVIRECQGTPVEGKLLGDGVLAVFTSARQAIAAALRCGTAGDDADLPLHLGIHAGDVIREGNNVYGGAVNIAARIAGASAPGEVLVSDTVRALARTSAGVSFDDRGEHALKGVSEPQRLFAVREGA